MCVTSIIRLCGSIQVSGDGPTLPSLRPKVWIGAGFGLGLGLREGRVGPSPETCIDPQSQMIDVLIDLTLPVVVEVKWMIWSIDYVFLFTSGRGDPSPRGFRHW